MISKVRTLPLSAYRLKRTVDINGEPGRLIRPKDRVFVTNGVIQSGPPNATIVSMESTFSNSIVNAEVLTDEGHVIQLNLKK